MANTTFTAKNLENLNNELLYKHMAFNDHIKNTATHCAWAATFYRSEDSNLADVCEQMQKALNAARDKADQLFVKIREALQNYITETVANEETVSSSLQEDSDTLADAIDQINSL